MFCPKCGMKNPETGKFCRSCGTDLSPISEALTGQSKNKMSNFGMSFEPMQPMQPMDWSRKKGKSVSWESMFSTFFTGVAFLIISIILGVTGAGKYWWFWLLIPAFAMIGTGLAQCVQLRKNEKKLMPPAAEQSAQSAKSFKQTADASLSPSQTDYVAPDSHYKTGDLVPPSVVENTTRHLEINSEGETMTLPKK